MNENIGRVEWAILIYTPMAIFALEEKTPERLLSPRFVWFTAQWNTQNACFVVIVIHCFPQKWILVVHCTLYVYTQHRLIHRSANEIKGILCLCVDRCVDDQIKRRWGWWWKGKGCKNGWWYWSDHVTQVCTTLYLHIDANTEPNKVRWQTTK